MNFGSATTAILKAQWEETISQIPWGENPVVP
jgi:hypothetical protein